MLDNKLQCNICNEENHKGILLLDQYICRSCEKQILATPPNELKYQLFKKKMRKIWKKFLTC